MTDYCLTKLLDVQKAPVAALSPANTKGITLRGKAPTRTALGFGGFSDLGWGRPFFAMCGLCSGVRRRVRTKKKDAKDASEKKRGAQLSCLTERSPLLRDYFAAGGCYECYSRN